MGEVFRMSNAMLPSSSLESSVQEPQPDLSPCVADRSRRLQLMVPEQPDFCSCREPESGHLRMMETNNRSGPLSDRQTDFMRTAVDNTTEPRQGGLACPTSTPSGRPRTCWATEGDRSDLPALSEGAVDEDIAALVLAKASCERSDATTSRTSGCTWPENHSALFTLRASSAAWLEQREGSSSSCDTNGEATEGAIQAVGMDATVGLSSASSYRASGLVDTSSHTSDHQKGAANTNDVEFGSCNFDSESSPLAVECPATDGGSKAASLEHNNLQCQSRAVNQPCCRWALSQEILQSHEGMSGDAPAAAPDGLGSVACNATVAADTTCAAADPLPSHLLEAAKPSSTTDLEAEIWSFIRNMEAYSALVEQQAHLTTALLLPSTEVAGPLLPTDKALPGGSCSNGGTSASHSDLIPDELWLHVFSYLTPAELSSSVAMVCRRWRRISADASLWTAIELAYNSLIAPHQLCYVASRAPQLHRLSLQGCTQLLPVELSIVGRLCPALRELDVGFCNISTGQLQAMAECGGYRRLHVLNVEGSANVSMEFVQLLCRLPELGVLNLSHCQVITDTEMIYLARHIGALKELNIDGVSFVTDEAIKELVLCHGDRLSSLDLDGAELTDESIQLVSASCRHLTHMRVSFCEQLTDASLQSLQSLVSLKSLSLRKGQQFTTAALAKMFGSQFRLSQLSYLDLSECTGIDDGVLKNLCDSCHRRLTELHLCWCWEVSEGGLEAIVAKCSSLRVLDLLGIDKITGCCFQNIPASLPHLVLLDLRQCNRIQDDIVLSMVKRNPDIQVYDYYGELFRA